MMTKVMLESSKPSSAGKISHADPYLIAANLQLDWLLPKKAKVTNRQLSVIGSLLVGWSIEGELGREKAAGARWSCPPHVALANLPRLALPSDEYALVLTPPIVPEAALKFTNNYGVLRDTTCPADETFHVTSDKFLEAYSLLRSGWAGEDDAITRLRKQASQGIEIQLGREAGRLRLALNNLWAFTAMLFLRDYAAGLAGRCANPACPAPYFVRTRRTQKVCENLECLAWAQRGYALKWWHQNKSGLPSKNPKGGQR